MLLFDRIITTWAGTCIASSTSNSDVCYWCGVDSYHIYGIKLLTNFTINKHFNWIFIGNIQWSIKGKTDSVWKRKEDTKKSGSFIRWKNLTLKRTSLTKSDYACISCVAKVMAARANAVTCIYKWNLKEREKQRTHSNFKINKTKWIID